MAQFDVYVNPSVHQRDGFPYLVSIQSNQLEHLPTRLVMPLQRLDSIPGHMPRRLSQLVRVGDQLLLPAAHQCAALPARVLRNQWRRSSARMACCATRSMP